VGKVVAPLRKHADKSISAAAKKLVVTWQGLLKSQSPAPKKQAAANTSGGDVVSKVRQTLRGVLAKAMMKAAETAKLETSLVASKAAEVESCICAKHGEQSPGYRDQIKTVRFGLVGHKEYLEKLLSGELPAVEVSCMSSDDFVTSERKQAIAKAKREAAEAADQDWAENNNDKILETIGVKPTEGMFPCPKCKSKRTTFNEMQTRSADEPTTKFCKCRDCGHQWRFC
jgi:transcription elongation factor S-II